MKNRKFHTLGTLVGGTSHLVLGSVLLLVLTHALAQGQTFSVIHTFNGNDGSWPTGNLVHDAAGNFFGTTIYGGANNCGTIFEMDSAGNVTVLYSVPYSDYCSGPRAGVIRDRAGNLYGTAIGPPTHNGYIFKLDTAGNFTTLYTFTGGADGSGPESSSLVRDPLGNLYGTTNGGGTSNTGTVFQLNAISGSLTTLHTFNPSGGDGASPYAGLVRDKSGNLYGTTAYGGLLYCSRPTGCGTVFKLDTTGKERVLHNFAPKQGDGAFPKSALVLDSEGNLYGTTSEGGDDSCLGGCGTIFKIDATGKETVLYAFTGSADGLDPITPLTRDAAGNLYGTTAGDFLSVHGTVFKLDTKGVFTTLYTFTGGSDGSFPNTGLVFDKAGNLFGTAEWGGDQTCINISGCGVIFEISF